MSCCEDGVYSLPCLLQLQSLSPTPSARAWRRVYDLHKCVLSDLHTEPDSFARMKLQNPPTEHRSSKASADQTLHWLQVTGADIGVITPYKAMANLLRIKLAGVTACQDVKVNTVDAFQGQEKKASSPSASALRPCLVCLANQQTQLL